MHAIVLILKAFCTQLVLLLQSTLIILKNANAMFSIFRMLASFLPVFAILSANSVPSVVLAKAESIMVPGLSRLLQFLHLKSTKS